MQVEISETKLSPNGAYALYGIRVNQSPLLCFRRFTEFIVLADKLNDSVLTSKLPSKLGFWQSSTSASVLLERKSKLQAFLQAVAKEIVNGHHLGASSTEMFYNFIDYSPTRGEQVAALEQQLLQVQAELEQLKQDQQAALDQTLVEVNERVDKVLEEKLVLDQTLVEVNERVDKVLGEKLVLEQSLVEERTKQELEAKTVAELKRQRGLLELEIARLENSQKSASEYGSQMSTKLSKAQAQAQKHAEEIAKLKATFHEQLAEQSTRVETLERELQVAGEIKVKLAQRVEELLATAAVRKE
ncbi:hypothetical protein BASA81_006305 [Batrachochytrium salamandrivorans]|nr:hypothetical protein BASA81_006305 [Batrachochytrium salamandrivorans]